MREHVSGAVKWSSANECINTWMWWMNSHTHLVFNHTFSHAHHFHNMCVRSLMHIAGSSEPSRCISKGKLRLIILPPPTHARTHMHTHNASAVGGEASGRCQPQLRLITVPSHQHTRDRRWIRKGERARRGNIYSYPQVSGSWPPPFVPAHGNCDRARRCGEEAIKAGRDAGSSKNSCVWVCVTLSQEIGKLGSVVILI